MGRINFVDVDSTYQIGHLGYRIGKEFTGLGVASKAVALLLEDSVLKEIHSKTTQNNIGSQLVLKKNGFKKQVGAFDDKEFVHYIHIK